MECFSVRQKIHRLCTPELSAFCELYVPELCRRMGAEMLACLKFALLGICIFTIGYLLACEELFHKMARSWILGKIYQSLAHHL
jgi:hypothetical protein